MACAMHFIKTVPLRCTSAAEGTGEPWLAALVVLIFLVGRAALDMVVLGGRFPLARVIIVVSAEGKDLADMVTNSYQLEVSMFQSSTLKELRRFRTKKNG